MSAFVVNNEHINAMLQAAFSTEVLPWPPSYYWEENGKGESRSIRRTDQAIGQKLVNENLRSVNHRYQEDTKPYIFQCLPFQKRYPLVQILKACNCYIYQSCESPDWKSTEAFAIVRSLKERAICRLPGYEEAAWEVCEPLPSSEVIIPSPSDIQHQR